MSQPILMHADTILAGPAAQQDVLPNASRWFLFGCTRTMGTYKPDWGERAWRVGREEYE